jgi:hypothetical protein
LLNFNIKVQADTGEVHLRHIYHGHQATVDSIDVDPTGKKVSLLSSLTNSFFQNIFHNTLVANFFPKICSGSFDKLINIWDAKAHDSDMSHAKRRKLENPPVDVVCNS